MFEPTALNARNARIQSLFRLLFGLMTGLLILPVLIILATLIHEGGSIISFDFPSRRPTPADTRPTSKWLKTIKTIIFSALCNGMSARLMA